MLGENNMKIKIERLKEKIREAYEESVRANCKNVTDILFECIVLFGGDGFDSDSHNLPSSHPRHPWTKPDYIVAFYLAKKYDDNSFRADPFTEQILKYHTNLSIGSLQMAIQNLNYLMGKKRGLSSVSNLAREVFNEYKDVSLPELEKIISGHLGTKEVSEYPSLEQNEIDKVKRKIPKWFNSPEQYNSIILLNYLELYDKQKENVLVGELRAKCALVKAFNFDLHFSQMQNIAPRNHAKVFNVNDGMISLWKPVKEFILSEYDKYCNKQT